MKWTKDSEQRPAEAGNYLVIAMDCGCPRITIAQFKRWWRMTGHRSHWRVVYWMPLPKLPRDIERSR